MCVFAISDDQLCIFEGIRQWCSVGCIIGYYGATMWRVGFCIGVFSLRVDVSLWFQLRGQLHVVQTGE
jgi:hypothetical protein